VGEADLYIAAMGRSGSTFLCNAFTVPPDQIVIAEPRFHARSIDHTWQELTHLVPGVTRAEVEKAVDGCTTTAEYIERIQNRFLRELKFWGVKEVEAAAHMEMIDLLRPRLVVVLVRDIEEVALSLVEKINRQQWQEKYDWRWIEEYVRTSAAALVEVAGRVESSIVIKYDQLLDPETIPSLACRIGVPATGDPSLRLMEAKREWEIERNACRTAASISPQDRGVGAEDIKKARELRRRAEAYNECFFRRG
jgi:hypothetical protein